MEMHTNRGKVKGEYKVVILFTMRLLESYLSNTKTVMKQRIIHVFSEHLAVPLKTSKQLGP